MASRFEQQALRRAQARANTLSAAKQEALRESKANPGSGTAKSSSNVTVEKSPTAGVKAGETAPTAKTTTDSPDVTKASTKPTETAPSSTSTPVKTPDITEAPAPIRPKSPNYLEDYSSYNYIFTLACLTREETAQPDRTYRVGNFKKPIARSGGGLGPAKVKTIYEDNGRLEYFIDNVQIGSLIAPTDKTRTTNATSISFEVSEPYSMGLFLQTLQIAAQPEYTNYLDACYMLKIEFLGYNDTFLVPEVVPNSTRYFPLKFTKVDFNVNEGGSKYAVQAIPWNEQALTDTVQSLPVDVTITGKNLVELLQTGPKSLASVVNTRLLEQEKAKQKVKADEIIIVFPDGRTSQNYSFGGDTENNAGATTQSGKDSEATGMVKEYDKKKVWESLGQNPSETIPEDFDAYASKILGFVIRRSNLSESIKAAQENGSINAVGKSKMITGANTPGVQPFGFAKFQFDTKNKTWKSGGVTISSDFRDYTFSRGTKIERIIEELVLISDYGRQLSQAIVSDKQGFIDWFRIDTQVYSIPNKDQTKQSGKDAKIYVYRVLPYKVHSSSILAPTKPGLGYDRLKEEAAKVYNYIYTGLNKDILEFDIQLNNSFFTAVSADDDTKSTNSVKDAQNTTKPEEKPTYAPNEGGSRTSAQGVAKTAAATKTSTGSIGGAVGNESTETRVARTFHEAITNGQADLLTLNITIIGDPYYIADSGMGNYNSQKTQYINITKDGSMNYQDSEVDVIVNFRTPIDYNNEGSMDFPEDTMPVNAFSGLYKVLKVENSFSGAKFTQQLQLIRRRNQDEAPDKAGAKDIATRVTATPEQRAKQAELIAKYPNAKPAPEVKGRPRGGA